ncbi:hypothetical protein [Nonomuraea basaltis]|uniref:hypothetical protein n=1 Tax=Nonomuraea basaltis TaxID=2495887 RepID=UPI001485D7C4|nr:hypothetical protein [Nonomuraea basaltis]
MLGPSLAVVLLLGGFFGAMEVEVSALAAARDIPRHRTAQAPVRLTGPLRRRPA